MKYPIMKRSWIQAKKCRKYLKSLAFKLQNFQITCQLFVLREEKFCEISLPNLKEFKNGETLASLIIHTHIPSFTLELSSAKSA